MTNEEQQRILDEFNYNNCFNIVKVGDIIRGSNSHEFYIIVNIKNNKITIKDIYGICEELDINFNNSQWFKIIQSDKLSKIPVDIYNQLLSNVKIGDDYIPGTLIELRNPNIIQQQSKNYNEICIYIGNNTIGKIKCNKNDMSNMNFYDMKIGQIVFYQEINLYHIIEKYKIINNINPIDEKHQDLIQKLISYYELYSINCEFNPKDIIKIKHKMFYGYKKNEEYVVLDSENIGYINKKHNSVDIIPFKDPNLYCKV